MLDALVSYTVVKLTFRAKTQHGNICLCFDSKIITFALNKVNIITFPVILSSFPTTLEGNEDFLSRCEKTGIGELNVCVKAAAKAKGERTLTWQLNGFGQLENCKVVGVLFYLTSIAGEL